MLGRKRKAAVLVGMFCLFDEEDVSLKRKRIWQRTWIGRRARLGYHDNLIKELSVEDRQSYRNLLRMDVTTFTNLVDGVSSFVSRRNTHLRECISPAERLEITLRFLATGESFDSLHYQFRVGKSTISNIIVETSNAIYESLRELYLKCPNTEDEWMAISLQFYNLWQFPNCLGAIDGKHVLIQPPPRSGSYYYNYKRNYSVVLLAAVDADLRFIYVDAGTNGRVSDGGTWGKSALKSALDNGTLGIPPPAPLPNDSSMRPFNFVFVGDAAFGLSTNVMRPFSNRSLNDATRIFNYRLSRCRRTVENVFGILANRFQIYRSPIRLEPTKVVTVILATCALHNLLRSQQATRPAYTPEITLDREDTVNHVVIEGSWRQEGGSAGLAPFSLTGYNATTAAKEARHKLCEYFNGDGAVSWQQKMVMKS